MSDAPCRSCGRQIPDHAVICVACAIKLTDALAAVPGLADELEVTITRQDRLADHNGGRRGAGEPLTFAMDPSIMRGALRNTLVGWVREFTGRSTRSMPWPPDDIAALARWLRRRRGALRRHPAAVVLVDEITSVVDDCRRAVDRPPDRWYAGPCHCGAELYAIAGRDYVDCVDRVVVSDGRARKRRGCGARHRVEVRRRWLLKASDDALAHAELAARALTSLGEPVTPAMIRGYAHRGRIASHGRDQRERPLYRIGDIRAVLWKITKAKKARRDRVA